MQQFRVVLVVDDDANNRSLIRALLSRDYVVLEAQNGRAALDVMEQAPVDLVLLDVMMPELNGFDTCRELKARHGVRRFLPVVLLTALSAQEERNEGLAAGADEFLTKPIDHRELALRVRALIRVLEQEELIRKQLDDLKHLQSLKDDLFSLVVHDLRNPLTGVLGFLELLRHDLDRQAHESARRHADHALVAAQQLKRLLDEVLEVRRLEEARLPLQREPTSLEELLRGAVETLEGAAMSSGMTLAVEVEDDVSGSFDRSLVRRAVENLLSNAIKASARNGCVLVRGRRDGERIVVEVADRGSGISDSGKLKLFKKFETSDRQRGTGLGLHLVKLVAGAHGGDVEMRDREGGGTVFLLSLRDEDTLAAASAGGEAR